MNCLFVNLHEPVADSGGIEAVTGILSKEFRTKGINTFCLWQLPGPTSADKYAFDESKSIKNLSAEDISRLLLHWQIDVVIVQAFNEKVALIKEAINISRHDIKLIYCLHSIPGWELKSLTWHNLLGLLKEQKGRTAIKLLFYPLFRLYHKLNVLRTYRHIYFTCEKVVLLSPQYIELFKSTYKINNDTKIDTIPNPCRFIVNEASSCIDNRNKTILIVSRLIENPKRILKALSIWNTIEKDDSLKDWNLTIVGDGPDKGKYLDYIHSNKLKRVNLVGQQNPVSYYSRAAIFMLTSSYEGFPMTLLEAQCYGCVPIVYNSFESIKDVISSEENGIIIQNNDELSYVAKLKHLMTNSQYLRTLSENSMSDSLRFSHQIIADKWFSMFESLGVSINQ